MLFSARKISLNSRNACYLVFYLWLSILVRHNVHIALKESGGCWIVYTMYEIQSDDTLYQAEYKIVWRYCLQVIGIP